MMIEWLSSTLAIPEVASGGVSFLATVLAGLTLHWLQPKSRIAWATQHTMTYFAKSGEDAVKIQTTTLWIKNTGRGIAENVELILNFRPQHFQIWPVIAYSEEDNPDGRFIIRFNHLGRLEVVSVHLLAANGDNPEALNVRWKDGVGREIILEPAVSYELWVKIVVSLLLLMGLFSTFYFATLFLLF